MSSKEIAEAFSSHKFESTYDAIADNVVWDNVGGDQYQGKAAVVEACQKSAEYMADLVTEFTKFQSFGADDRIVVESQADYIEASGVKTTVASCDIYTFSDGMVVAISSYNAELAQPITSSENATI